METNIDLKKIWNKQKIEIPNVETLYVKASKLQRRNLLTLILINITVLFTIIFIGFIWYYYQPEFITTKIGIILTILAMIIFLLPFNKQFYLLNNEKEPNSKEYLQKLIKLKEAQVFQQTRILSIYFIMLSLGVGLYMFEYAAKMTFIMGIIVYATVFLWFAINWFYLRPRVIIKKNAKLNKLIVEFENLNSQMIS